MDSSPSLTVRLLRDSARGDLSAANRLFDVVYDELHVLASRLLARERRGHTLQATALVHETYLKLVDQASLPEDDRGRFLAIAALTIRRVLRDHAKARHTEKRGGGAQRITLDDSLLLENQSELDFLNLDEALAALEQVDPRCVRVVEMRHLAGLTIEETASALKVSERTVTDDWKFARAWLQRKLEAGEGA